MIDLVPDKRPVIVAIAGPNGAGKTTFFHAHLREAGLRYVNADEIGLELDLAGYDAAKVADAVRRELVRQHQSFIFETVFSDPVGEKLAFLVDAVAKGYNVVLCFIGVSGPETCEERVAMRVSQGGHDVSSDKLVGRFPRVMANLQAAIRSLPTVLIFDHENLAVPFRKVAEFRNSQAVFRSIDVPRVFFSPRPNS
jgi:predicted ABC-type ATPase